MVVSSLYMSNTVTCLQLLIALDARLFSKTGLLSPLDSAIDDWLWLRHYSANGRFSSLARYVSPSITKIPNIGVYFGQMRGATCCRHFHVPSSRHQDFTATPYFDSRRHRPRCRAITAASTFTEIPFDERGQFSKMDDIIRHDDNNIISTLGNFMTTRYKKPA